MLAGVSSFDWLRMTFVALLVGVFGLFRSRFWRGFELVWCCSVCVMGVVGWCVVLRLAQDGLGSLGFTLRIWV